MQIKQDCSQKKLSGTTIRFATPTDAPQLLPLLEQLGYATTSEQVKMGGDAASKGSLSISLLEPIIFTGLLATITTARVQNYICAKSYDA